MISICLSGSYYPDQYTHYASAGTLPVDDDDEPSEDMEYHGNERPDLHANPPVDPIHDRQRSMPPNQPARGRQNGTMPNNKKPKKLKVI